MVKERALEIKEKAVDAVCRTKESAGLVSEGKD
jgi:hypothetical protein